MNSEPVTMFLCETEHIFLKPNVPYLFEAHPDCAACRRLAEPQSNIQTTGSYDPKDDVSSIVITSHNGPTITIDDLSLGDLHQIKSVVDLLVQR